MRILIFLNSEDNQGTPENFTIEFSPALQFDRNKKVKMCLVSQSMSYSWFHVSDELSDRTLKYSHDSGMTFTQISLLQGHYNYSDLNNVIQTSLVANSHSKMGIMLQFVGSLYRVQIALESMYRVDLRQGDFSKLIGFERQS